MINGMKKLLAVALLSSVTVTASASAISIKGSNSNPNVDDGFFDFDTMTVQTDADGGSIAQSSFPSFGFIETGTTEVINFNDADVNEQLGLDVYFEMQLQGTSAIVDGGNSLAISFDAFESKGQMYYDDIWDTALFVNTNPAEKIADLTLQSGECLIDLTDPGSEEGNCNLVFGFDVTVADRLYSAEWGYDLVDLETATITFEISIDSLEGFDAPALIGGTDLELTAYHSGTAIINVPEPSSLAILGLGLLGLAGVRRRA